MFQSKLGYYNFLAIESHIKSNFPRLQVIEMLLIVQKVMCIYVRTISLSAIDLTTHVQVITNRYDTPTNPNA